MPQSQSSESHESCEPPLRPLRRLSLIFIGRDRRGNWVVREQAGLFGGLFVGRRDALRFAMLESGRPRAVVMVPGILEFGIDEPRETVANDHAELPKQRQGRVSSARALASH